MAYSHQVTLTLLATGTQVDVWDQYSIAVDMFKPANPWTFTLWHSVSSETASEQQNRRTAWTTLQQEVKHGDLISLAIDGSPEMIGFIETVDWHHSRGAGAGMTIGGRDMAAIYVDWDADTTIDLRMQSLGDVFRRLFTDATEQQSLTGFNVVFGYDTDTERSVRDASQPGSHGTSRSAHRRTQNVDVAHPRPGERVWQLAEKICKRLGYLMWIAPSQDGTTNVVVDVPAYESDVIYYFKHRFVDGSQSIVTSDSNVLDMHFATQTRDIPTRVIVYGRFAGGDTADGRHTTTIDNTELQRWTSSQVPGVASQFPDHIRHIHADRARTAAAAMQEGTRVLSEANRDFRLYKCTVQGHGQSYNGSMRLYAPNSMAHVKDSLTGLDEDMLIQRVEFEGSRDGGQTTKIVCHTQGAISLVPEAS